MEVHDWHLSIEGAEKFEDLQINSLIRCGHCQSYFKLLKKEKELTAWEWGIIPAETVKEIDKALRRLDRF